MSTVYLQMIQEISISRLDGVGRNNFERDPKDYSTQVCFSLAERFQIKYVNLNTKCNVGQRSRGCRGRNRMVVGFRTTYAISAYHH